jgi:hypothetical protein
VKNIHKFIAGCSLILTLIVILVSGCTYDLLTSQTPSIMSPSPTAVMPVVTTNPAISDEDMDRKVIDFIKNTATFKFDGDPNSLSFTKTEFSPISSFRSVDYIIRFQTAHPGHGNRKDQIITQVVTEHTARVYFDVDRRVVRIAACDNSWDLIKDHELPKSISGIVISGGDTAPLESPLKVPHTLVFQVRQQDGSIINVSYETCTSVPSGDTPGPKIKLELYAASIQIGDQIWATGRFDQGKNRVVVEDGGYIRTAIPKMQVLGRVISGGDDMPAGLMDAPHQFRYILQKDDNSTVNISYQLYPPSSAGEVNNSKIQIVLYNGAIKTGDYLMAYGTYDLATNTIMVKDVGDLVKNYPFKPQ